MNKIRFQKWGIYFCVAVLCAGIFTGCDQKENKVVKETAAPAKTPVKNPEDTKSNLGAWTRAMGSVLIELNEGDPYIFGGYEKSENNKAGAIKILKSTWNIDSKKSLLKQVRKLLKTGDRTSYRAEAKEMKRMSKKNLKIAMKQLSGEYLYHYQMVQYNWKTWGNKGLLAWDMCRISHLAQWGYIADYLTLEEAQGMMEPAIKKVKENFSSWEEVQNNWLDGYCLFAGIDRKAKNTDYTNRKSIYEKLKEEQEEGKLLYDDALFQQPLKGISGVSYSSIMKENFPTPTPKPTKVPKGGKKTKTVQKSKTGEKAKNKGEKK